MLQGGSAFCAQWQQCCSVSHWSNIRFKFAMRTGTSSIPVRTTQGQKRLSFPLERILAESKSAVLNNSGASRVHMLSEAMSKRASTI